MFATLGELRAGGDWYALAKRVLRRRPAPTELASRSNIWIQCDGSRCCSPCLVSCCSLPRVASATLAASSMTSPKLVEKPLIGGQEGDGHPGAAAQPV